MYICIQHYKYYVNEIVAFKMNFDLSLKGMNLGINTS